MLSTLSRRLVAPVRGVARFHRVALVLEEKKKTEEAVVAVDKTNPLYAPDNFEPWRNTGYTNLAPKGWKEWTDLPAPYKYYDVKVDPKDVESPGFLWNVFTNWRTGLPVATLLALPAFVYDVVVIDERFELMLIFWSTIAIFQHNFGGAIKSTITDAIAAVKSELLTAEKKYNAAVEETLDVHKKGQHVTQYIKMVNAGERALKHIEAASRTRAIKVDQSAKLVAMLDYLVQVSSSQGEGQAKGITASARVAAEKTLASDAALQQKLVENAIAALETSESSDTLVDELFRSNLATAVAKAEEDSGSAAMDTQQRDLFLKRFGFHDTVTEDLIKKAKADPAEWAVLVGKCGGEEPTVGRPILLKSPLSFLA